MQDFFRSQEIHYNSWTPTNWVFADSLIPHTLKNKCFVQPDQCANQNNQVNCSFYAADTQTGAHVQICVHKCISMYVHVLPLSAPGSTSAYGRREHLPQGHPAGMMPASGGYSSTHRHTQLWTSKVSSRIVLIVTENGPVERRKVLWLSNEQNQLHGQPSLWTCLVPPHAAETVFPTFLPHSSVPFHYVAV